MLISTREVAQAQDALEADIADLDDDDLRAESGCAGWTRGHVLTHIARNAEGMANLARWALDDAVVPMYAPGRRDADIEEGSGRRADQVRDDIAATNTIALEALGELEGAVATDPLVAERVVRLGGDPERGSPVHARRLPLLRLQEVVLHHHDLRLGLQPQDWPDEFVTAGLPYVWTRISARFDDPPRLRRRDAEEALPVATRLSDVAVAHVAGPDVAPPLSDITGPDATSPHVHGSDVHGSDVDGSDVDASKVEVTGTGADLLAWVTGRADDEVRARLSVTPDDATLPTLPAF